MSWAGIITVVVSFFYPQARPNCVALSLYTDLLQPPLAIVALEDALCTHLNLQGVIG